MKGEVADFSKRLAPKTAVHFKRLGGEFSEVEYRLTLLKYHHRESQLVVYLRQLKKRIFGISLEEATFARRGFTAGDAATRHRLERIGKTFLQGYHAALEESHPEKLAVELNSSDPEYAGFSFEGAAMAMALQDYLLPWKRDRFQSFLSGPGSAHIYMVHVGLGWALARLRRRLEKPPGNLDPLLGWLALDGYGFHEGYFHWRRYVENLEVPERLSGYARRVFDQGLGRSLWFVKGADVALIPKTIAAFPELRHEDLWSGVGLACAYAGGAGQEAIEDLRRASGLYTPQLAQGAAFAAKTRQRAGNPTAHTEMACQTLCKLSAEEAAAGTDAALVGLDYDGAVPAYEVWRQRIQSQFVEKTVAL